MRNDVASTSSAQWELYIYFMTVNANKSGHCSLRNDPSHVHSEIVLCHCKAGSEYIPFAFINLLELKYSET